MARGGPLVNGGNTVARCWPMAIANLIEQARTRRRLPEPRLRRLIRESARVSLREVAATLGVSPSAVSRWETGQRKPRAAAMRRYVRLLDQLAGVTK